MSPGKLVRAQMESPTPRGSDSVGLGGRGWGLRICISNELPGDADAASLVATLRITLLLGGKWVWKSGTLAEGLD